MTQQEKDVQNLIQLRSALFGEVYDSLGRAIEQMKTLIPVARLYHREEYPEHLWRKDENGEIDTSAWEYEYHSGPFCERCYYSFCESCDSDGYNKKLPCAVEEFTCPTCGAEVTRLAEKCPKCNQVFIPWDKNDSKSLLQEIMHRKIQR